MTRADPPKCNPCHERPQAKSQRLCKPCRNAVLAERRAKRRIEIVLGEPSARADDPRDPHDPPVDPPNPQAPGAEGNGQGGNGHTEGTKGRRLTSWPLPSPRTRLASRIFLTALAKNNAEAVTALTDGLVKCAKSENPWVVMNLWRDLRDMLEGPWKAPEAPTERPTHVDLPERPLEERLIPGVRQSHTDAWVRALSQRPAEAGTWTPHRLDVRPGCAVRCHRSLIADALLVRAVAVEHILSALRTQPHVLRPWADVQGDADHVSASGMRVDDRRSSPRPESRGSRASLVRSGARPERTIRRHGGDRR